MIRKQHYVQALKTPDLGRVAYAVLNQQLLDPLQG